MTLSILVKSNLEIQLEKELPEPIAELLTKLEPELASESSLARLNPSFSAPDCKRDRLEKSWKPDVGSLGFFDS